MLQEALYWLLSHSCNKMHDINNLNRGNLCFSSGSEGSVHHDDSRAEGWWSRTNDVTFARKQRKSDYRIRPTSNFFLPSPNNNTALWIHCYISPLIGSELPGPNHFSQTQSLVSQAPNLHDVTRDVSYSNHDKHGAEVLKE